MQMIQFGMMNAQGYLMVSRECPKQPWKIPVMYLIYVQSLFWLFLNFFIRAYFMKPRATKPAKKDA